HQPRRVRAHQLDRGRDLGRRRRTRHALRRRRGRDPRELRQDLLHGRAPGGLALRARRVVRRGHAVPAARPGRALAGRAADRGAAGSGGRMKIAQDVLYLEKLTVSFDGFKALNALTLYVEPGELRCIIGPNGAGKTTMMDVITGKTRPDEGRARF